MLKFWQNHVDLNGYTEAALVPYFAQAEQRPNIAPWQVASNENNALSGHGGRNVKGCWNLGSCGLGCPTDAKQSMQVTTISAALNLDAQLLVQTRAERFELVTGRATSLMCQNIKPNEAFAQAPYAHQAIEIIAKYSVFAGAAINSLAVLLRQGVIRLDGVHGQLGNFLVHDGLIFATRIGTNPPLSVYGTVKRLAQRLAKMQTGRDVALA